MPTPLKLLTGNRGRRPLNEREPKPKITLPAPPDHLDLVGRAEWRRMVRELYELGIMSNLDVAALASYCAAFSDEVRFARLLRRQGLMLKSKSGARYMNPLVGAINTARRDKNRFAIELGATPASRSRIRVDELPKGALGDESPERDEFLDGRPANDDASA